MLEPKRSALLLMDFQNFGVHPDGYWAHRDPGWISRIEGSGVVHKVARALAAARAAGLPVIHVTSQWREGHPDLNAWIPVFASRRGTGVWIELRVRALGRVVRG